MPRRHQKKDYERFLLDQFIKGLAPPPLVNRTINFESPDFILETDEATIGIELREVMQLGDSERPLQEQENLREQIVALAQVEYEKATAILTNVSVHFRRNRVFRRREVETLARQLAEIVVQHAPSTDGQAARCTWLEDGRFSNEIADISIQRFDAMGANCWNASSGGVWVPKFGINQIQTFVDEKSGKCGSYLTHCDAVWLVLAFSFHRLASIIDLEDSVFSHSFPSGFNRIFVLHDRYEVRELVTTSVPRTQSSGA